MKKVMIKEYLRKVLHYNLDVDIIEDTVVLSFRDRWHMYVYPDRVELIGCVSDDDIEMYQAIKGVRHQICEIQDKVSDCDETV